MGPIHLYFLYYMERKSTSYVKYGGPKVLGMALKYLLHLLDRYKMDKICGAMDTAYEKKLK
jgi:hypothetical protein